MKREYFFICGCARSGTTALWDLVSAHPEVAVGVERYIGLATPKQFNISEDLFEESRFFDLQEADTHYKSLFGGQYGKYYRDLKGRYDNCKIFGDKIPRLYKYYAELSASLASVRFLFIFRNVFDVAQSFNARTEGGKWAKNRDYTVAVTEWNTSLAKTLKFVRDGGNVLCLEYEELFWGGVEPELTEKFLGLQASDAYRDALDLVVRKSAQLDQRRDSGLTTPQKKYIMHNANFKAYKEILRLSLLQRGEVNP